MELDKEKEFEVQLKATRDELHQRERSVDKLESALEQRQTNLMKQETIVTSSQNRLKIKLEQQAQTEKDILEVRDQQRKQLHEVTGLSQEEATKRLLKLCLLYTSPSPRDRTRSRMPSSA